ITIMESSIAGSISGTVLPLDIGANVMAVSSDLADTSITQVDAVSGAYMLRPLHAGSWDVTAFAAGYQDSTKTGIMVQAGVENSGNDFTLVEQP
ncbi:MAG TPA: carboxypeptidase-like regulatory domain-containing protein, partial [Candidatus Krumholzibacteria bacterium]|nr:carboxypeptidase-like regulatory domain-containing protein [Candidatus Krumholzibacteria bacterium]